MLKRVVPIMGILYFSLGSGAFAWNAKGHQIVGTIADAILHANAKQQVASALGVDLRTARPWLYCVKSVHHYADGTFHYVVEQAFEEPCKPFAKAHAVMQQYVKRNFA
jgi:hypothetical protein